MHKRAEYLGRHDWYYSDAYRTIANIALDYAWFGADEWEVEEGKHFLKFFCETAGEEHQDGIFAIDGTVIPEKLCIRYYDSSECTGRIAGTK